MGRVSSEAYAGLSLDLPGGVLPIRAVCRGRFSRPHCVDVPVRPAGGLEWRVCDGLSGRCDATTRAPPRAAAGLGGVSPMARRAVFLGRGADRTSTAMQLHLLQYIDRSRYRLVIF